MGKNYKMKAVNIIGYMKFAKGFSFKLLFKILYWKITKHHDLRESQRNSCQICKSFFYLRDYTENINKKGKL